MPGSTHALTAGSNTVHWSGGALQGHSFESRKNEHILNECIKGKLKQTWGNGTPLAQ